MSRLVCTFFIMFFLVAGNWPVGPAAVAAAEGGDVIQSQETNYPGIVAELVQFQRKKGVLTVKLRVKNTSSGVVRVHFPDVKKTIYLMDPENQKKYFLLKDATGEFIWSGDPWDVPANGAKTSWFKFPAPPTEVKEITFIAPNCPPFEDIPIEDK